MSRQTIQLTDQLYQYLLDVSLREPKILKRLREETAKLDNAQMQISPEQGQFMSLLVKLINAKRTIEVGVFTGYSSLAVALALPEDGKVSAFDINDDWTQTARKYWKEAGVEDKIDLTIGPAAETLQEHIDSGVGAIYDFAFIDADKTGYDNYYELCLQLMRPGGLIAFDNVLRNGRVAQPDVNDDSTAAIRKLNEKLHTDDRVEISMLPISDGLTLAMKC